MLPLLSTVLLATALFIIIALLVSPTQSLRFARYDTADTLTILSISLAILTVLLSYANALVFEKLGWKDVIRSEKSARVGSGAMRLEWKNRGASLLASRRTWSARLRSKAMRLIVLRNFLLILTWLAGVLLLLETSLQTTHTPHYTYPLTAGVGPFNASLIPSYITKLQSAQPGYTLKVMPYAVQALAYNLISNPIHSVGVPPVSCEGRRCASTLLTGGLYLSTPWPPGGYEEATVTRVECVVGRQVEFDFGGEVGGELGGEFGKGEFTVYDDDGATALAVRVCLRQGQAPSSSFVASLAVCSRGLRNGTCIDAANLPRISANITVFRRTSTIIVSRSNFSIISVTSLSDAIPDTMPNLSGLRQAIDWLLDFHSAGIPAMSSIAALFWNSQEQMSNNFWDSEPSIAFQSIIAYPLWMFQANNFGNVDLPTYDMDPNLPRDMYTTASLASPLIRIQINESEYIAFVVFECIVLVFLWASILWLLWKQGLAKLSSQNGLSVQGHQISQHEPPLQLESQHSTRPISSAGGHIQTESASAHGEADSISMQTLANSSAVPIAQPAPLDSADTAFTVSSTSPALHATDPEVGVQPSSTQFRKL